MAPSDTGRVPVGIVGESKIESEKPMSEKLKDRLSRGVRRELGDELVEEQESEEYVDEPEASRRAGVRGPRPSGP